jgi:bifunctional oligoribonuclease and PAP phosphatase NrnA
MGTEGKNQKAEKNSELFKLSESFIISHHRFLMASHARTDGDDCGSMLAVLQVLDRMGKQGVPLAKGGVPDALKFLPDHQRVLESVPEGEEFDAIILFGCGKKERTGIPELINSHLPILNIDHHPDNQMYGSVNLVDSSKSSVAELVLDFIKFLKVEINSDISKCLLTGIFTDTGSFMHANTQASTLQAAAELMQHGARVDKIHNHTYKSKDLKILKAWALALENTFVDPVHHVAISALTSEDLKQLDDLPLDAFGGFTETLNTIPGTKFAIFLRQDGEVIKGSIRSEEHKKVDVSYLARLLGGGGHKLAAGFEVKGKIVRHGNGWKIET